MKQFVLAMGFGLLWVMMALQSVWADTTLSKGLGVATAQTKNEACRLALESARKDAAQQAASFLVREVRFNVQEHDGEVKESFEDRIIEMTMAQSTLRSGSQNESSRYDEVSGAISCEVLATFDVDTGSVKQALETQRKHQQAKQMLAERISRLTKQLQDNEDEYKKLKQELYQVQKTDSRERVICATNQTLAQCDQVLEKQFLDQERLKLAAQYKLSEGLLYLDNLRFVGQKQNIDIQGALARQWTGVFEYLVAVENPFMGENASIRSELMILQGRMKKVEKEPTPQVVKAHSGKGMFEEDVVQDSSTDSVRTETSHSRHQPRAQPKFRLNEGFGVRLSLHSDSSGYESSASVRDASDRPGDTTVGSTSLGLWFHHFGSGLGIGFGHTTDEWDVCRQTTRGRCSDEVRENISGKSIGIGFFLGHMFGFTVEKVIYPKDTMILGEPLPEEHLRWKLGIMTHVPKTFGLNLAFGGRVMPKMDSRLNYTDISILELGFSYTF
ncbi:MAG: phage tail tape measure protein [Methyloprofundus sp.]|nr:phage tail tape measure protein [Methyloprofundus sp.]